VNDLPAPETFLSGEPLALEGRRARYRARVVDAVATGRAALGRTNARLDGLAVDAPERSVRVLSIYRPPAARLVAALPALWSARGHRVDLRFGSTGDVVPDLAQQTAATGMARGKFENLNALWPGDSPDWTLIVDDDVVLPDHFLDRFIGVCERFDLAMAQPAQTHSSHAAWPVTRRRPGVLVRESRFVEIGPVTAFRRDAAEELLPFPELRYGWGLDVHWAALAEERGWRLGIVDALAVRHDEGTIAATYSSEDAIDEARRFLAGRPYVTSARAQETVAVHRRA
jgi:hypothetical protein